MRSAVLFVCTILMALTVVAGELLPETQKVKVAYEAIVRDGSLPENQVFFLKSFPNTKDTFIRVFIPNEYDQLYTESRAYVEAFGRYGEMYPQYALPKAISLSKGLLWASGAVADLHEITLRLANANTDLFITELKKLKKKEVTSVIYFLANAPNAGPDLQILVNKLKAGNGMQLADQFTKTMDEQKKAQD